MHHPGLRYSPDGSDGAKLWKNLKIADKTVAEHRDESPATLASRADQPPGNCSGDARALFCSQ